MHPPFFTLDDLYTKQLAPGVSAALAWGKHIMLSVVTIEPAGEVALHQHPHEQAGYCIEGEFELEIGGDVRRVKQGEFYLIPGDTPHAARGVGMRAVALDIFSPLREDYLPEGEKG